MVPQPILNPGLQLDAFLETDWIPVHFRDPHRFVSITHGRDVLAQNGAASSRAAGGKHEFGHVSNTPGPVQAEQVGGHYLTELPEQIECRSTVCHYSRTVRIRSASFAFSPSLI